MIYAYRIDNKKIQRAMIKALGLLINILENEKKSTIAECVKKARKMFGFKEMELYERVCLNWL